MSHVPQALRADFSLHDAGSIAILYPLSPAAEQWVAEHLPSDALTWAGGTAIERRYVVDILCGILDDGLEVL